MRRTLLTLALVSSGFAAVPVSVRAQREIAADKITDGRTSDEKVYEYGSFKN